MTCTISRPTPQEAFNRLRDNFSSVVLGGSPVIPESNEWYVISNDFAAQQEMYSIIDQQLRERDPRFACCDNLIALAEIDGVYPRPAGFAQGYVKITGTVGASIPSPLDMTFGDNTYRVIGSVALTIPVEGYVIARVQAIVPGSAGNNIPTSGTGSLLGNPVGLDKAVTAYGSAYCGGSEAESCEAFRSRYLERKAYKPRATMAWLKEKLLEWPCVTRVFERAGNCCEEICVGGCDCNECGSKMEFYVLFDNTFECGIAPQCVIDDINTWVFGEVPGRGMGQVEIGVCGSVFTPTASVVDVHITGAYCLTSSQASEIKARVKELFQSIGPSEDFDFKLVDLAIAQVLGVSTSYEIRLEVVSGTATVSDCNGLNVPCDVLPCLGEVMFDNEPQLVGVCY